LEKRITNTEVKIQNIRAKPDAQNQVDKITKFEEQITKVSLLRYALKDEILIIGS